MKRQREDAEGGKTGPEKKLLIQNLLQSHWERRACPKS